MRAYVLGLLGGLTAIAIVALVGFGVLAVRARGGAEGQDTRLTAQIERYATDYYPRYQPRVTGRNVTARDYAPLDNALLASGQFGELLAYKEWLSRQSNTRANQPTD